MKLALVAALVTAIAATAHAEVRYELDVSGRQSPAVATPVTIEIDDAPSPLVLVFANWLPGAYELRWFGRDVTGLAATADQPLAIERVGPDRFVVRGHKAGAHVSVHYRVTASLLSDDGGEVSATHVYLNPAAVLPRVLGLDEATQRLGFHGIPSSWKRATSLDSDGPEGPYRATSWRALADAVFEASDALAVSTTTMEGVEVTIGVHDDVEPSKVDPQLVSDVQRLLRAEVGIAGPFPHTHYLVLVHESDRPGRTVGLEHAQATSIVVPATNNDPTDARDELRHMIAHEIFHAWNARRLVPAELVAWDPERPQASRDLWISEGLTEYAALLARVRAGLLDRAGVAASVSELLSRTRRAELGLSLEALSQLAFAAPHALAADEDAYYAAGATVSLAITAELIRQTKGHRDLADVVRALLPPRDAPPRAIDRALLGRTLDTLAPKAQLSTLLDTLVTQPLSFAKLTKLLKPLTWTIGHARPDTGVLVDPQTFAVQMMEDGGAFSRAGIETGDRIATIDGTPVTTTSLEALVKTPRRALVGLLRATMPLRVWLEPRSMLGELTVDAATVDPRARLFYGPR